MGGLLDSCDTTVSASYRLFGARRMRWQWVFNPDAGPFTSPLRGCSDALTTPAGHEAALGGEDQYCLVQIWRAAA
ncbi:hypothetical protein [Streptomyces sp. NPDC046925]|uniref:hypothetical protein n=1 Tax=Streptomyces sp. NPDC046925 TaxID=3155375 RepID=UPI0033EB5F7B